MNAVWIVLPILTLLMFELGLTLEIKDFKLFRQRPYPVIAGLIGQIILLPVLAFALGYLFHLEPLFFYWIGTHSLFSGRKFFQYILYDCQRRCGTFRFVNCPQQHYHPIHYSCHYGVCHTSCRRQ